MGMEETRIGGGADRVLLLSTGWDYFHVPTTPMKEGEKKHLAFHPWKGYELPRKDWPDPHMAPLHSTYQGQSDNPQSREPHGNLSLGVVLTI